jgi:hypothetical protein
MNKNRGRTSLYIDQFTKQTKKLNEAACGDQFLIKRFSDYTVYILCDGIGSGIKGSIAATMCANRILNLVEANISLINIACRIANLMHRARSERIPFSTFTIVKILNNGQFNILCYENPIPFLLTGQECLDLEVDYFTCDLEVIGQISGRLREDDSLIIFTDGVSQAGLGRIPGLGWGRENIQNYLVHLQQKDIDQNDILDAIFATVRQLSGGRFTDDVTATILNARKAKTFSIMSGPPQKKEDDEEYIDLFMNDSGKKALCGSTTADIASRILKRKVEVIQISPSFARPPEYSIEGIDIVTEGTVTLNQVYNILERDPSTYDNQSCVSTIAKHIHEADSIKVYWGHATNTAHQDTSFIQMGILERNLIMPLLIEKLQKLGKTVEVINF